MTDELQITSPAQFKALAHPLRHRLLYALHTPSTVSQLAARLAINKGSAAHHLGVLVEGGLVRSSGTRQVRGGTERYYERLAGALTLPTDHAPGHLQVALGAVAAEIETAAPDPLLTIRHLRLTAAAAERLRASLAALVDDAVPGGADEPHYGVLVGLYQQSGPSTPTDG